MITFKQFIAEATFDWDTLKSKYTRNDAQNEHRISVFNDSGAVGYIEWDIDDGEIQKVFVGTPYRRLGVGTHLWELAIKWAEENKEAEPEHSSSRSKEGDAWAKSVGGQVPELEDDIDGWTRK